MFVERAPGLVPGLVVVWRRNGRLREICKSFSRCGGAAGRAHFLAEGLPMQWRGMQLNACSIIFFQSCIDLASPSRGPLLSAGTASTFHVLLGSRNEKSSTANTDLMIIINTRYQTLAARYTAYRVNAAVHRLSASVICSALLLTYLPSICFGTEDYA